MPLKTARIRLPAGFSRLRDEMGGTLRDRRRDLHIKQEVLARDVGISREALSAIERGRSWPRAETLDRLLAALDLELGQVAEEGPPVGHARRFDGTARGDAVRGLGSALRIGRRRAGITLRELAGRCGVSAAQLSRIERGDVVRSRVFVDRGGEDGDAAADARVAFADPVLAFYAEAGSEEG